MLHKAKFVQGISPKRNIEAKTEELFGADLEFVAEFLGVVDGGFELWVADFAFFGVDVVTGFELSHLFAKVFHDNGGFDGINIHRNIKDFVDVDEARNPTGIKCAWIPIDIDSATVFGAKAEIT